MDNELAELLARARTGRDVPEDSDERQIAMAAANGIISDSRVTIEAMRAARIVDMAARKKIG